jgi:hypothetical protein
MSMRHWTIGALAAVALSMSPASYGQQERVTWAEAVDYVAQHGAASSLYGPVAMNLGLGTGTVNNRVLSMPGNPKRDFYVTENTVVLSVIWTSGASRAYTASKEGVLRQVVDRSRTIPVTQAAGAFEAEKQWWIANISDRAKTEH